MRRSAKERRVILVPEKIQVWIQLAASVRCQRNENRVRLFGNTPLLTVKL